MIVICACAYYLCQNCTTDQVAKPIVLTTTVEEHGLAPHSSQLLFLARNNSIFYILFPHNTLTLRHTHLAVGNHPEIEKEKKEAHTHTDTHTHTHTQTHTHTHSKIHSTATRYTSEYIATGKVQVYCMQHNPGDRKNFTCLRELC